ncbi:hypothetical protein [Nocardia alba]|uniref:Small secreted domain DUF320 n=1 Tax=Nocardia alba TaxID=225051 RepID=A0A4R1FJU6_9NOCA|nr:hypothetical protein [Nocardia alba]TCJ93489.1 hypothetical protein DFR71_5336 [Nocardia alba]
MILTSRALRTGTAVLAVTAGLVAAAGPVAAESPLDSGSGSLGTGSSTLVQSVLTAIGCYVGANSCGSIIIPL